MSLELDEHRTQAGRMWDNPHNRNPSTHLLNHQCCLVVYDWQLRGQHRHIQPRPHHQMFRGKLSGQEIEDVLMLRVKHPRLVHEAPRAVTLIQITEDLRYETIDRCL